MALRKRKQKVQPNWHPNFRDEDNLPDIKVIRTDFLFNLVGISLSIVLFGIVVYREYRMYSLVHQLEGVNINLMENEAADRENVKLSNEFVKLSGNLEEISKFKNIPLNADELLYALAVNQPVSVVLEGINFKSTSEAKGRNTIIKYALVVNGTVEDAEGGSATKTITNYRKDLAKLDIIKDYFEQSELVAFSRNDTLGFHTFTIRIMMAPEALDKGKSKK